MGHPFFSFFFARMCLKRKSEKTKIARPKINNQKCPPCGRTSNYRKSWAPRPQQLETPRLTLGKIRRETSLEPESVPQKYHCHQLWYSLLPGADTCLVSAPAQNFNVDSTFAAGFTPSSLRAGTATQLFLRGVPLPNISWLLRHARLDKLES